MRNLIIFFLLCITVSMSAQPILPSAKQMKFPNDYLNKYEPPYLIKPQGKGGGGKQNKDTGMKYGATNPMDSNYNNPTQDSINKEMLRLLQLYGDKLATLNTPIKDTCVVNVQTTCMTKPDNVPPKHVLDSVDIGELSRDKRHGWYWIAGGVATQITGGVIFANKYKPTTITNKIKITSKGVKTSTEVNHHPEDNVKAGLILTGAVVFGGAMEFAGINKLSNVHVSANGVSIPLFAKRYKHK